MSDLRPLIAGTATSIAPDALSGAMLTGLEVRIGGEPLPPGTPIVGVPGLAVELHLEGVATSLVVAYVPDPSRPDAERLRELASFADAADDVIAAESPVALSRGDVDALPREGQLADRFEHLAQVCASPQARLTRREEVVSLQRARRIGARSAAWLGSHPAAWAGRRGRGPIPERVLAEQPDQLLDIYENRVVATLVDTIERHLRDRIRALDQYRERFEERQMTRYGSWRMRDRVGMLWAESWLGEESDSDAAGVAVAALLEELRGRHRQVRALRHRPGYAGVPPRHRQVRSLVLTNIFRGDDRYHHIARLWRSFGTREVRTPAQDVERQLATMRGHQAFVRCLVHRAAHEGLAGALLDPLGEAGSPRIEWRPERIARLDVPGAPTIDVVPMFCAGDGADIAVALGEPDSDVLVVVQPPGDEPAGDPWRRPGGRLTVVAESPAHLGAVETIGLLVRAHVLGARYAALPPRLTLFADVATEVRDAGVTLTDAVDLGGSSQRVFHLLEPITEEVLERARLRWVSGLRGAKRESRERRWADVARDLVHATHVLERARPCPTPLCGGAGRLVAELDRVVLSCSRCDGRWGMQRCPEGHPVPFAATNDDAELLNGMQADVAESRELLGLNLVRPIGVRDDRFGALCPVCASWTRLPIGTGRT